MMHIISVALLVMSPLVCSLAITRPMFFPSQYFMIFPVLSVILIAYDLRGRVVDKYLFLCYSLVLIIFIFLIINISYNYDPTYIKYFAMMIFYVILPVMLASKMGKEGSLYTLISVIFICLIPIIVGSLILPKLFYFNKANIMAWTPQRLGWFANPNEYGSSALLFACSGLALNLDRPWKKLNNKLIRTMIWILILSAIVAIFISHSRGALLALATYIVIIIPVKYNFKPLSIVILVATALLAYYFFDQGAFPGISDYFQKHGRDFSGGRFEMWDVAVKTIEGKHELFGLGMDKATALADIMYLSGVHNAYIKILIDMGVVGLLLFIIMCLRIISNMFLTFDREKGGLFALFFALLVHSLFEQHIFTITTTFSGIIFWQYLPFLQKDKPARIPLLSHIRL